MDLAEQNGQLGTLLRALRRDEILARENSRTRTPGEDDELEAAA